LVLDILAISIASATALTIALVACDMRKHRRNEEAIRLELDNYLEYFQIAGAMLVVLTPDWTVRVINRKGCEILGYNEGDVIGKRWYVFLPTEERAEVMRAFALLINADTSRVEYFENKIVSRHHGERIIAWHNTVLRNKTGQITGTLSSGEDVTERRRAEAVQGQFVESVLTAQEEERRRISRELHDQTGQSLMSILVGLRAMEDSETIEAAREVAESLRHMTSQAMKEVERLAQGLRPAILDDMGLEAALKRHASDFAHTHRIEITVDVIGIGEERLSPNIEVALFRVTQEALTNVAKHALANRVSILLERHDSHIQLVVEDNGVGFQTIAPENGLSPTQLGLYGMKERVDRLDGTIDIESSVGHGTTIHVRIPLT